MDAIMIAGMKLEELQKLVQEVRVDASKVMALKLEQAKVLIAELKAVAEELSEVEEGEEEALNSKAKALAVEIYPLLEIVSELSNVSRVEYNIPYDGDGESDDDDVLTAIIEGIFDDWNDRDNPLYKLHSLADIMQTGMQEWNSSNY